MAEDKKPTSRQRYSAFQKDLTVLIAKHSVGNDSDTSDDILADYLVTALVSWNHASFACKQEEKKNG